MGEELTKRQLLINAISNLVSIEIKLERELSTLEKENPKYKKLNLKLEVIKEQIKNLVSVLDIYFIYKS